MGVGGAKAWYFGAVIGQFGVTDVVKLRPAVIGS